MYIGSTCRSPQSESDSGSIAERVYEYCMHGSHKKEEINKALEKGYMLFVRFKVTGTTKEEARKAETDILSKVSYAWNIQYPNPEPRQLY